MDLSIERKIEIERELAKALCDKNTKRNIVVDGMLGSSSDDETKYYICAYIMPFEEISRDIEIYNSSYRRITDIKFLNYLCTKYFCDLDLISQRLLDVIRINRYLKENSIKLNQNKEEVNVKRK